MKKSVFVSTLVAATAMAVPAFAETLTWGGSSESWTDSGAWSGSDWTDNSDAIFSSGEGTVTVTGEVTAGSVTIQDGGSYTFNISAEATLTTGTLTNSGSLALTGSGTIVTGTANNNTFAIDATNFTGTLEITAGRFDVGSSVINSDMTVVLVATTPTGTDDPITSNDSALPSLFFGNVTSSSESYYQFVSNLVVSGSEGTAAILRTYSSSTYIEFAGSVTSEAAELQINGGGTVKFSGTVDLAKYIVYQGNTTFSGSSINIGTLELASDSAAYSTTFSASATVGTLETSQRSFQTTIPADSLVVNNSATLTIGEIILAYEIDLTTTDGGKAVVTGNVTASGDGKLVINEGSTLTATGETGGDVTSIAGIAGAGTLSIEGTAIGTVFTVTTDSSFTGTVDVTKGYLRLDGTSIASGATLVVQASAGKETTNDTYEDTNVSIQYGGSSETLAHDITVEGTGGVIIRSQNADYTATFSGNISGDSAAYLQLNGGGSAVFTGSVTLENGGYINYQGSTTFTNAVKLGSLAIYQPSGSTNAVTFSGSTAVAEIGTLTLHSSEGSDAINLVVSDGASLTVGTLAIDHDVAIAIDNATMSITSSASVSGDKSASITISNGGTLNVGTDVTLNNATINIVLGVDNISNSVDPTSAAVTFAYGDGVYALTGSGSLGSDVSIIITVDQALATLLSEGGEYTINVYEEGLTFDGGVNWDTTALDQYGISWDGDGTISVGGLPEPELFSVFFGLGAVGLVATRRRRRVA